MPIDIVIRVHDDAAAQKIKQFAGTVEKESGRAASKMEGFFKRASSSVISSTSNMGGSVTSVLAGIGGKAGVAGLAVTALGASMAALANKAAKAGQEIEAIKFTATLDVIGKKTDEILVSLGSKLLPMFNRMFEFLGLAASAAEVAAEQTRQQSAEQTKILKLSTDIGDISNDINATLKEIVDKRKNEGQLIDELDKKQAAFTAKLFDTNQAFAEARALLERIDAGETLFPLTTKQIQEATKEANEFLETFYTIEDAEADAAREEFFEELGKKGKSAKQVVSILNDEFQGLINTMFQARDTGSAFLNLFLNIVSRIAMLKLGIPLENGGLIGMANGGILGAANGFIVRRPTMLMMGEGSKPEAVIPLSPEKSAQRSAVMQEAGLNGGNQITVNISANSVDDWFLRHRLMPELNRQVRAGARLQTNGTIRR